MPAVSTTAASVAGRLGWDQATPKVLVMTKIRFSRPRRGWTLGIEAESSRVTERG